MDGIIRQATIEDVPRMVALSEQARKEYARQQPIFWRKAADAVEKQQLYFSHLLGSDKTIALVYEHNLIIEGFVIGTLTQSPPVYAPGGSTCLIDDFMVADETKWQSWGVALLNEVVAQAKAKGAVQAVVISAHFDSAKNAMLSAENFPVVSEWRLRPI